jgi:hypothetical protein
MGLSGARFREHLGNQAGDEIGRPTGWIGHDDAYGPVRVVGVVSRPRAGNERDSCEQGNKISTSHCNTGHSISLGIQSEQQVPITPDPRSDDAG